MKTFALSLPGDAVRVAAGGLPAVAARGRRENASPMAKCRTMLVDWTINAAI